MMLLLQLAVVEVTLGEDDAEPEQHLDEGEHIQRIVVPLDGLYDKLMGRSQDLEIGSMALT